MTGHKTCGALMALTLFTLSASPAQAQCATGKCGGSWWNRWFSPAPTTAYYAPQPGCGQPACGQVVNYMPQTCYRTVYVNAPVVSYQPVTSCDPCTGCPTTVMRPVTSFATQARLVPYTTYRPVVTAAYAPPAPACSSCAPLGSPVARPVYYAPAVPMAAPVAVAAPVAPAAPACCGANATTAPTLNYAPAGAPGAPVTSLSPPTNYAPNAANYSQAPGYSQTPGPVGAPTYGPITPIAPPATNPSNPSPAPALAPPPSDNAPNKTFNETEPAATPEPQSRMLTPIPGSNSNTSGTPRYLDSEDQDRSTSLPVRHAYAARQVSAAMPVKQLDNSGWRAARN